jgi:hypothetical protein
MKDAVIAPREATSEMVAAAQDAMGGVMPRLRVTYAMTIYRAMISAALASEPPAPDPELEGAVERLSRAKKLNVALSTKVGESPCVVSRADLTTILKALKAQA